MQIPEGWDDWSVFKFAVPPEKKPAAPIKGGEKSLHTNVILSRQTRAPNKPLAEILAKSNEAYAQTEASFTVIEQGSAEYFGNAAAWQDSSQNADGMLIFQRHVVIARSEDEVLLLTITGNRKDLDRVSKLMALPIRTAK